jgi:hypothetical protein
MTPIQRVLSVLGTLKCNEQRLKDYDLAHGEITEQIYQIEDDLQNGVLEMGTVDSSLVTLVKGFEQIQRVQTYLYGTSYAKNGMGSMSWAHWFDGTASAVEVMRTSEDNLRADIAKRIGATLN